MRCLTKNLAMFGLGLYIYAGEDLPENDSETEQEDKPKQTKTTKAKATQTAPQEKSIQSGEQMPTQFLSSSQKAKEQPKQEQTKQEQPVDPERQKLLDASNKLVSFCNKHKIDIKALCIKRGLTKQSTVEDFQMALVYAETLVPGGEG